jgi:hypothetical protein
MSKSFVSHTSGTRFPGTKGQAMKRGSSVMANEARPGGSQKATERVGGSSADGGGDKGAGVSPRTTPENKHGL